MRSTPNLLLVTILIITSTSCHFQQNKQCKQALGKTVRQINAVYQGYQDNKEAEENLNMFMMRNFYSSYTDQFSEVRNDLAEIEITKKYRGYYDLLNATITESTDFINTRQTLMSNLFETSSNFSSLEYYTEMYWEYY